MYILCSQVEMIGNIQVTIMRCISLMEYQWINCYSIGTNCTIGTNGRVECTLSQVEMIANILSPHNEMNFTNGIPMD